jgi:fatty-acyl-CoA synthase
MVSASPLRDSYRPAEQPAAVLDTTVGSVLAQAAAAVGDRIALVEGVTDPARRRRWTYAGLYGDACRAARAILRHAGPGERVALLSPNRPEWVIAQFGAALAGVTLVTVNPGYVDRELHHALAVSGAVLVIYDDGWRDGQLDGSLRRLGPRLGALRHRVPLSDWPRFLGHGSEGDSAAGLPAVAPGEPALLQFTSGRTGTPKAALLHHRGVTNVPRSCFETIGIPAGTVFLNPLPLFHAAGCCTSLLGTVARHGTFVLAADATPGLTAALVADENVDAMGGVTTTLIRLLDNPQACRAASSLTHVLIGASTVPPDLIRRIETALGVEVFNLYGQTELSPVFATTRIGDSDADKACTVGKPLPQADCKIIDPATGDVVPLNTAGELCARGYQVMMGYSTGPQAPPDSPVDGQGWLHTGDLAAMDHRGYLTITGRLRDLIIRGGENIHPAEVEAVVLAHAAIEDVAVIGLPHPVLGETIAAVLRLHGVAGVTSAELARHCASRLSRHKIPERWFVITGEFPQVGVGKVRKSVLRQRAVEGMLEPLP